MDQAENKLDYIVSRIEKFKNIQILELGVQRGISTKKFLEICEKNEGFLTSIDIDDCSKVAKSDRWKFIQSSDDNFNFIMKANLSQPIFMTEEDEFVVRLKQDF